MITTSEITSHSLWRARDPDVGPPRIAFIIKIVIGLIIFGVGFSGYACTHLIDKATVIGCHWVIAALIILSGLKNRREALIIEKAYKEQLPGKTTVSMVSAGDNVYITFSGQKYEISPFMAKRSSELTSGYTRILCGIPDIRGAHLVVNYLQTLQFPTYCELFARNREPDYKYLVSALLLAHELKIDCLKSKIEKILALVLPWSISKQNLGNKGTAIQRAAIQCELPWLLRQTYIVEINQKARLRPERRQELENSLSPIIDRPSCPAPFEYLCKEDPSIISNFNIPSEIIDLLNPLYREMLHALIKQSVMRGKDLPILRMLRDYLYCGLIPIKQLDCFNLYRILGKSSLGEDFYQRIPGFEIFWEPSCSAYQKCAKREVALRHSAVISEDPENPIDYVTYSDEF